MSPANFKLKNAMKLRLNKKTLAEMPTPVRALVQDWRDKWHKSFISVCTRSEVPMQEDAKITVINLLANTQQTERVAGEFAGMTKLSPTDNLPLPHGCVAVVSGFFCGHPWLTIYQGRKDFADGSYIETGLDGNRTVVGAQAHDEYCRQLVKGGAL